MAKKEGMLVLDCTSHNGFISASYYDVSDPEKPEKCTGGFPGRPWKGEKDKIMAPSSLRSPAETYSVGDHSYQFNGRGGLSWSIPYVTGVLALGWQIAPDFSGEKMRELLFQSAYKNSEGNQFINPPEFIRMVQSEKDGKK
ncbi:hypothetical protein HYY75_00015 [bacterium]|nr:hypothetical protein [bacterium]